VPVRPGAALSGDATCKEHFYVQLNPVSLSPSFSCHVHARIRPAERSWKFNRRNYEPANGAKQHSDDSPATH